MLPKDPSQIVPSQEGQGASENQTEIDGCPSTGAMAGLFHGALAPPSSADHTGKRLGPWRLVKPLSEGGMGSVWLGERCDDAFHMYVAVKLMKDPLASPDLVTRFKRERQFLADLAHPHIATLHDGGTTADGMPYLVMEYVEGHTIDRWVELQKPDLDLLLVLFDHVCRALAFAHDKGVLHRDIKPHNIMVTAIGQPKLLDFGIATSPLETSLTHAGPGPMTPAYAAPERLSAHPATVASDIFSLALVLLELLCGNKCGAVAPFTPAKLTHLPHMDRLQRERPSLFNTLSAALEGDPSKRPESVERFRLGLYEAKAGNEVEVPTAIAITGDSEARRPYQWIPPGYFLMGQGDGNTWERPQHEVFLPGFYMARYPVTREQYAHFLKANPQVPTPAAGWVGRCPVEEKRLHPVTDVSLFDAQAYCRWLSQKTGIKHSLPGEAEWEKAAGGSDGRRYPWGGEWDETLALLGPTTFAVDDRQESPFGCCHMLGNVQEWTSTRWGNDPTTPDFPYPYRGDDGRESARAAFYVHRGGAFRDKPNRLGCRIRGWSHPEGTFPWRGFRVKREGEA